MTKSIQYYSRAIHRILGYLAVGMVFVYALSGITLIHRSGDFMKKDVSVAKVIQPGLDKYELKENVKVKNLKILSESESVITFGQGTYNKATGELSYTTKETIAPMNKLVELHKMPDTANPHIAFFTTAFGIVLFLLALTSLFMYKANTRQFKSNMAFTLAGIALAVILLILV